MNAQIIFASLRARPVRTLVSILAVALEVVLILMVVGLLTGVFDESGKRVEGVGADILVQPPGASIYLGLSPTSLSPKLAPVVAAIPGVKVVTPVLVQLNIKGTFEMVEGIDPPTFDKVSGGLTYVKGAQFSDPNDIIIDDVFAKTNNAEVGGTVHLLNHDFKVSGIVEHGKGARVYMSLPAMQALMGVQNVSFFYVSVDDPKQIASVSQAIVDKLGEGYSANNARDFSSLMTSENVPGLKEATRAVIFISVCVGVMVLFLSMYTTVTERTREIGILRSLGGSKSFIVILVMQESIVISLIGVVVGLVGTQLLQSAVIALDPTKAVLITPAWRVYASLFAILSGIIGALYPSVKAAAKDPIEALAYE